MLMANLKTFMKNSVLYSKVKWFYTFEGIIFSRSDYLYYTDYNNEQLFSIYDRKTKK